MAPPWYLLAITFYPDFDSVRDVDALYDVGELAEVRDMHTATLHTGYSNL